jgi:hypothetical protein
LNKFFPSKDDFERVVDKLVQLHSKVDEVPEMIKQSEDLLAVQAANHYDGIMGAIDRLIVEYAAMSVRDSRRQDYIEFLANHIGVALPK